MTPAFGRGCFLYPALYSLIHTAHAYTERMANPTVCGWKLEKAARKLGALRIAGLDEVGRGCLLPVASIRLNKSAQELPIS